MILHDGTYTTGGLSVGVNLGTGSATGRVHLDRILLDTDSLTLGEGANLELEIRGLLRGSEYSALDAGTALLDGNLAIAFVAPPQLGIYDLVVSGGIDGIQGAFDAVTIAGLAASQQAFWGIETDNGASGPVEVFRLHVVPEPGTAALVGLGLLGLALARRRAP
jgi:PEP-CTERM motif